MLLNGNVYCLTKGWCYQGDISIASPTIEVFGHVLGHVLRFFSYYKGTKNVVLLGDWLVCNVTNSHLLLSLFPSTWVRYVRHNRYSWQLRRTSVIQECVMIGENCLLQIIFFPLKFWTIIKACGPYVVILMAWMPIVEWYMARFVVKNGQQKDTCCNEIRLCAQNIDTC